MNEATQWPSILSEFDKTDDLHAATLFSNKETGDHAKNAP